MPLGRLQLTAALLAALALAVGAPDAREVMIAGRDYAFEIPAVVQPGRTAFAFENRGKQFHELNITLLKPGATTREFMAALDAGRPTGPLVEAPVGVLFAFPGKRATTRLVTELQPGRTYVVICIMRDTEKAPRHLSMGMFKEVRVASGAVAAVPALRVDTVIGVDYAFKLPATLAPGRHHFAFVNRGTQRHEISVARLKPNVTLSQYARISTTGGDVDSLLDEAVGVLHAPGGRAPYGLLEVTLEPGREYVFECTFQNDEKSPTHDRLGMIGSVRVSAATPRPAR